MDIHQVGDLLIPPIEFMFLLDSLRVVGILHRNTLPHGQENQGLPTQINIHYHVHVLLGFVAHVPL